MDFKAQREIERRLEPWSSALGADRTAYSHHVLRVLGLCDLLWERSPDSEIPPSGREEYLTALAFHDLGIWSAGTMDYLGPSVALAHQWLDEHGQGHHRAAVAQMIEHHHKLRPAGRAISPVEIVRRADLIDVTLGLIAFGIPRRKYRDLLHAFPDAGFHPKLVKMIGGRFLAHPLSPMPMIRL
ncbi:hypothetical protein [Hoyosella altamirensis]|uniref:HD domain-containing protein n=1 Tax=Hoyosella altamirensis TaxID=616997 RepID=A0A839RJF7_9ACTN|nr:hypothetical protein [Hoyosella altamirensis]MBB3036962.1 hypothetical protein [Hoyosella altamirensis]